MDAVVFRRQADITYFSLSSRRVKTYLVHPYRLVYGLGALYLLAYVETYKAMRTFAVSRLRKVTLREEHFTRDEALASRGHSHSLGMFDGQPVHVEVEFAAEIAPYIKEREWHPSQGLTDHPDGRVTLTLEVCDDWALRSWLLGFGPRARVLAPAGLVDRIRADLEAAAARYSAGAAESADAELHDRLQRVLPFWTDRALG
jgi:predicted DNA-binding transcriptional regulator YafY